MPRHPSPASRGGPAPVIAVDLSDSCEIASLRPRNEPYWMALGRGRALGLSVLPRTGQPDRWYARLRLKDGAGYRKTRLGPYGFLSFEDARWLDRRWFAKHAGIAIPEERPAPTLRLLETAACGAGYTVTRALNDYLRRHAATAGPSQNEFNIARRVARHLGGVPIRDLKAQDIARWLSTALAEPARTKGNDDIHPLERVRRRKATLNRQFALLRAALNLAFVNRHIDSDAEWRRVAYYRHAEAPAPRPISPEAIEILRNNAPAELRRLIDAALFTGCRFGELSSLRCRDVIAASRKLVVPPAKRSPVRTVDLSDAGWRFLETLRAGRADGDWLVRRTDGSRWTRSTMWGHLYAAAQRDDRTRGINFHMLRHTYANRIRDAGMPLQLIARQLGHRWLRTTEHYYVGIDQEIADEVIRKVMSQI